MVETGTTQPADLAERSRPAGGDKSAGGPPPHRFSAKRKLDAVSRLMRGKFLELVSRELNVTAARLSSWRDQALLAAETALKERERDARDDEIVRLKGKVGAMTMEGGEVEQRQPQVLDGVMRQAAAAVMRPDPWAAGRP